MSAAEDIFDAAVLACVEDVNTLLPELAARYSDLVMVAAIAEHVGGALRICIRNGTCTPEQARHLLDHMRATAFTGQPKG
jgi:hypothetical protein